MSKKTTFELIFIAFLVASNADMSSDLSTAPSLTSSDSVQYFYLESSFPYNTPQNIKNAAGSSFINYGVSHAGLGVWDTTTDVKFSIEFISSDYVGALLPTLTNGQINWDNAGTIVITNPLIETNWLNSRLVSTTTGSSWNQMVTYLQDNTALYATYQPVTVMFVNSSLVNSTIISTDDLDSIGGVLLEADNSFAFVDQMLLQLSSYGCSLGAFLQIYATSFDYLSKYDQTLGVVEWDGQTTANPDVYAWYTELNACYATVFDATSSGGGGEAYFANAVKSCYGDVAYVYRSATSVFNVSLAAVSNVSSTSSYATPEISQYIYNLPPDDNGDLEQLGTLDYLVVALFCVLLVWGVIYALRKFFGKKDRRRVSFEGERIATRTVNNLVGADAQDDHEEKAYYHGKKRSHTLFGSWTDRGKKSGGVTSNNITSSSPRRGYQDEESVGSSSSNSLERPLTSAECRLDNSSSQSLRGGVIQQTDDEDEDDLDQEGQSSPAPVSGRVLLRDNSNEISSV